MSTSKVEAEQAFQCSPSGRGRGRGVRAGGQSSMNSPTASRRPPRALYTPGAFSKQRRNTDSKAKDQDQQDCENVIENNETKWESMIENEKSLDFDKLKISSSTSSSLLENRLSDTIEEKCASNLPNDSTIERIDSLDVTNEAYCTDSNCDSSISNVQSSDSVEHLIHSDCSADSVHETNVLSETDKNQEKVHCKSKDSILNDSGGKTTKIATTEDRVTNSSKSSNSKAFPNQEQVSEITVNEKTVERSIENEEHLPDTESVYNHKPQVEDSVKNCGGLKSVSDISDIALSNSNGEVDQASRGEDLDMEFSESNESHEAQSKNKQQHNVNLNDENANNESKENDQPQSESKCSHNKKDLSGEDDKMPPVENEKVKNEKAEAQKKEWQEEDVKIVGKNNDSIKSTENICKVEGKSTLKDVDNVEMNESVVDSENINRVDPQSKSKRQSKKEEKAKKKEERLKKKQEKTKSEKTKKVPGVEGKGKAKEGAVCKQEGKEKSNKGVKAKHEKGKPTGSDKNATASEVLDSEKNGQNNRQEKGKEADSMADDQGLKIVRECKDTLQRVSVSEDLEGSSNEDSTEEDWEKTWDDDGECLDEELFAELNKKIDTTNVQVVKPQFDYLIFKPNDTILDSGVFDHVVEIFDFSPEFKTHDLVNALSKFQQQGFDIHWVDDTHALAVFSNHRIAQQAIEQCSNPMVKLRSVYEGTQQSKLKAKRNIDVLQPYKERPKTTKLVANRLVAGALGMKSKMSKEERQLEREKIKAEREKKLNKEKQKKDLWDSDDV